MSQTFRTGSKSRLTRAALGGTALMLLNISPVLAAPKVIASIKPVQSLVAAVMDGVGEPSVIVDGAASPHTFALKPSTAKLIADADVVFWVGPELEPFLSKPLETLGEKAQAIELSEAPGVNKLPVREDANFEPHDHGHEEGEAGHSHAGHDHSHGHSHSHDHGHGHGHEHGEFDAHVWLDPENAKAMADDIAHHLSEADPENAATYAANAAALKEKLTALETELAAELEPVKDKPFIVFHDAYQYFEHRFGVRAAGSVTLSPEVQPGAERVAALRTKLKDLGAVCVFSEPQFEPKLVSVLIEGTDVRSGVLDPLGAGVANGKDLYFEVTRNMAASLKSCLSGAN
ncbi:zinc ABC transporter substrate-binding protein ZnuA [Pannonibacter indicus]|uniref:High-affinity zinc uptake system protein ZnuA n=1 Tax=Pannonibacter indicus TaxID=466044 RepID=A0A0K6HYV1_9HYPH|nr:ABC-type Zn2+ transport system, periplasmic component/surface adhesin [Pannonibacter indicus]